MADAKLLVNVNHSFHDSHILKMAWLVLVHDVIVMHSVTFNAGSPNKNQLLCHEQQCK